MNKYYALIPVMFAILGLQRQRTRFTDDYSWYWIWTVFIQRVVILSAIYGIYYFVNN